MEYADMTLDELQSETDKLAESIASIKAQIETSRARKEKGMPTDYEWMGRARAALKFKGVEHQKMLRLVKNRKVETARKHKEEEDKRRERLFIEACKEMLDKETYLTIWNRVELLEQY